MHEHDTKTSLVFLLADGEASWLLLPSSVYLLPGGTRQPEKKNIPINLEFQGSIFRNLLKRAFLCLGQFKGKFYFEMP